MFVTVFEVDAMAAVPGAIVRLAIGLLLGTVGALWLRAARGARRGDRGCHLRGPVGLLAFGVLWTVAHAVLYVAAFVRAGSLAAAYRSGRCVVVEGRVAVLHRQPAEGHDMGDLVRVGGVVVEVNYFGGSVGYRRTIAHGGVLTEGTYVRLYCHDGQIARVDIRRQGGGRPADDSAPEEGGRNSKRPPGPAGPVGSLTPIPAIDMVPRADMPGGEGAPGTRRDSILGRESR